MISFLFGIHNHQPVGNEEKLLNEAYEKCYKPFLQVFSDFKKLKLNLHFSGWLLKWLGEKHPDFFDELKKMISEKRLELLSGGFYEPILSILKQEDAKLQIRKLNDFIQYNFGYTVKGAWIAERVWEQKLVKIFSECGIDYVPIDDYHFVLGGMEKDRLNSYCITESEGKLLKLLPISKELRYMIPFSKVEEVIDYMWKINESKGECMLLFFDDGEKFGMWPGTFELVYKERWLFEFFSKLCENSDWIESMTISEYIENSKPAGKIYIPTASYYEMTQWSKLNDEPVGYWRNFLVKYEESNLMYGKMNSLGEKMEKIGYENLPDDVVDLYLMSQVNDPYWHGVFGGIYSPNLRQKISCFLSKLENQLDNFNSHKGCFVVHEECDIDLDGFAEKILKNENISLIIDPNYGGRIISMVVRKVNYDLSNTMRRRFEKYHHDMERKIPTDWYGKYSLIDHFFRQDMEMEDFIFCEYPEQGNFVNQPFDSRIERNAVFLERHGNVWVDDIFEPVYVEKKVQLDCDSIIISHCVKNEAKRKLNLFHGLEFNLSFLSDRYGRYLIFEEKPMELSNVFHETRVRKIDIVGEEERIKIRFTISQPVEILIFPIRTISKTEKGMEEVYQESTILLMRRFELSFDERIHLDLTLKFEAL